MIRSIVFLSIVMCGTANAGVPRSVESLLSSLDVWYLDSTDQWKYKHGVSGDCVENFAAAEKDGVSDTLPVELTFDTPYLKKGTYPLKDLRDLCRQAVRSSSIRSYTQYLGLASSTEREDTAIRCISIYDENLIKESGMSPTDRLPYEGMSVEDPATGDPFSGTIEEARNRFCDPIAKPALEAKAKQEAPYRKELKADKLRLALSHIDRQFFGPRKRKLDSAKQLRKANVWFRWYWYTERGCNHGAGIQNIVVRYKFNAKHVLVDESSKTYCGSPPAAAFR